VVHPGLSPRPVPGRRGPALRPALRGPDAPAFLGEPVLLREERLLPVCVAPLRWNPASGALQRLAHLELRLVDAGPDERNDPPRAARGVALDAAGELREASLVGSLVGDRRLPVAPGAPEAGPLASIEWSAPPLPLNYLVFARAAAAGTAAFADWLEWKRARGHRVDVVTDADLASWTINGIRGEIAARYLDGAWPPHYVLLVGDTQGGYALPTHADEYDHFYSTVSGDDDLADVIVGRISVETSGQLTTVVNKILGYERHPYLDDPSWLRRASFLTGQGHCGESMSQLSRSLAFELVRERGYQQIDTAFCALSPNHVYGWYNAGTSLHSYRGIAGMEGMNTWQILGMGQGPRTPVAGIFTCLTGDFAGQWSGSPCYTEAFLRAGSPGTPGGAVTALGFATPYTETAYNNVICSGFWNGALDRGIPQAGTCLHRGKLELWLSRPPADQSTAAEFMFWANQMGDPGMEMWLGVPGALAFEALPAVAPGAARTVEVRVLDGEGAPAAGAAVCASQPEGPAVVALADADGRAWLELPALAGDALRWVATLPAHVPADATAALDAAPARPLLAGLGLADADGDGAWEAGETAALSPVFANPSAAALPACAVTLALRLPESGEVLQALSTLPALPPDGSAAVTAPFGLRAAPGWTEGAPLELAFALAAGDSLWTERARPAVAAPRLEIGSAVFVDGPLLPGGSALRRLTLRNDGPLALAAGELRFSLPEGCGVTAAPESVALPALAPGDSAAVETTLSAAADLVPGYTVPLTAAWGGAAGPSGARVAPVALGAGEPGDPTGPDAWGYYAFESTDGQWAQAPIFQWLEIAPLAGGDGTVLDLHDTADEHDDSRLVALPFTFTLYGRDYDSLAVCSNGFVAFGPQAGLQTDFRDHPLPGPLGPEPMLAPMWDDHYLNAGSQVCVRSWPEAGLFIVEWYRVVTNGNNHQNTFQLLLHDPAVYPTPTGDGDVVFQWLEYNDLQSHAQDFPYSSTGIEDHTGTVGLTLRSSRVEPATVEGVGAGVAVRFTTAMTPWGDGAQLTLLTPALAAVTFAGAADETVDTLRLANSGAQPLFWQATVLQDAVPRDQGGPDAAGYTWIDSESPDGPAAGWVDVWERAATPEFTPGVEGVAGPLPIGFPFPFYGEDRDSLWISANGFLSFVEPASLYWQNNGGLPGDDAPELALLPWWEDLFRAPGYPADSIRWWSNGADSLVAVWNAAPHFNPAAYGGPFTFQVVLEADGRIAFNYGDMADDDPDSDSGTIGVTGPRPEGFAVRHMQPSRSDLTIRVRPPYWLRLQRQAGVVAPGGETAVAATFANHLGGWMLAEGVYETTVRLRSNDPHAPLIDLPATLVNGEVRVGAPRPAEFALGEPWPNPFNPATRLRLTLPAAAPTTLRVFNLLGQEVARPLDGRLLPAGEHVVEIDGAGLASGLYLLQVEAGGQRAARKALLLK